MDRTVDDRRPHRRPGRLFLSHVLRLSVLAAVAVLAGLAAAPVGASQVELISRAHPPFPYATGSSYSPSLSADGRYVAFLSGAGNLAPGQADSFAGSDAFLHDRVTGITTLLTHRAGLPSVATESSCVAVQVSADGRYAAFASGGTDLVPGQTGSSFYNLFLYDRLAGTTRMVSHAAGSPAAGGDGSSTNFRLSQDGRYVAYESDAKNLVAGLTGPTNSTPQVFLWDRDADTTALVSHNHDSPTVTGRFGANLAAISADGAYVAFNSDSDDLISGVTFPTISQHVFLSARTTGTVSLIDHASGAPTTPANSGGYVPPGSLSGDGRFILFESLAGNLLPSPGSPVGPQLYLYDRASGAATLVSHRAGQPDTLSAGNAQVGTLSTDGRFVAFNSSALDLVAGETGATDNFFLWDRTTGAIRLLSHLPGSPLAGTGGAAPFFSERSGRGLWIDASGDHVAFRSTAANLVPGQVDTAGSVDLFVWDRTSDTVRLASHTGASTVTATTANLSLADLADAGGTLAFDGQQTAIDPGAADPYDNYDVFVYNRASQALALVSRAASPSLTPREGWIYDYDPAISLSADGRFAVFLSDGIDLVPGQVDRLSNPGFDFGPDTDVFLYDRVAGTTVLLSHDAAAPTQAVGGAEGVVSADGRYVAFWSRQGNAAGNVFLYDRILGQTILVSHASGAPTTSANGGSSEPVLSADGRYVAFQSYATDLVAGQVDTNQTADVFLYDRTTGTVTLVSHANGAPATAGNSTPTSSRGGPAISPDGRYVAFNSGATDSVAGGVDANNQDDVFLYDRLSGSVTLVSHASGAPATAADGLSFLSYQVSTHRLAVTDDGHVVFFSQASNLVAGQSGAAASAAVFLYDAASGTNVLVSHRAGAATAPAAGKSDFPVVSADGRTVAYLSPAADLAVGQSDGNGNLDVFLYDAASGANTLVSHAAGNPLTAGNARSRDLSMSDDGRTVAFSSEATDLVPSLSRRDLFTDVYVWHRDSGAISLASYTAGAEAATGTDYSWRPAVSGDGRAVAFMSFAADLVASDANGAEDVYVYTEAPPSAPTGFFFTLRPCRLFDTRLGGGALHSGGSWALPALGACGIPATAVAIVANVTAVQPTAAGFLTLHPAGIPPPVASSLNFSAGQTRSNNAVVRLSGSGTFAVSPLVLGSGTVDVILDVVGYFE
jgi:Tol biopolymer transport system component